MPAAPRHRYRRLLVAALLLAACRGPAAPPASGLRLTSSAFNEGGKIPVRFTCDGENVSPPLVWTGAPAATRSFALVVNDPDAPAGDWVHWVVFNLPAGTALLAAGPAPLPEGTGQGRNDFGEGRYGGPCPPGGTHRYVHTLYALDTVLTGLSSPTRDALQAAMKGHVLASATLTGRYSR